MFNAVVNRVFGPEVNGHAANLVALMFLASLPATAGLPTVVVRYVSRAFGGSDSGAVSAYARLSAIVGTLLTIVGIAGALATLALRRSTSFDLVVVGIGIAGYAYWRIFRSLLVSVGQPLVSLKAELASVLALWGALAISVVIDSADVAVAGFVCVYLVFAALTIRTVWPHLRGQALDRSSRSSFVRHTLLWFVASGASLAVKEVSVLLLDRRADKAVVGEFSVALSLLMMLALASRVLELPLLHELSALAGKDDRSAQRALTERAIDWMSVIMVPMAFGVSLVAVPLLDLVAHVRSPEIALAFVVVAFAFSTEMLMTPASNLMVSEAPPEVLTVIGAASFAVALAYWISPVGDGFWGVVVGLALSHVLRSLVVGWYVRTRHHVALFRDPVRKVIVVLTGSALLFAVTSGSLSPWVSSLVFGVVSLVAFRKSLSDMVAAAVPRRAPLG